MEHILPINAHHIHVREHNYRCITHFQPPKGRQKTAKWKEICNYHTL